MDSGKKKIQISKLAEEMSPGLSYADIEVKNIRHSYNPFVHVHSRYNVYVIFFTINNKHSVKCTLLELRQSAEFDIRDCSSPNANVKHDGFVRFKDLGSSFGLY